MSNALRSKGVDETGKTDDRRTVVYGNRIIFYHAAQPSLSVAFTDKLIAACYPPVRLGPCKQAHS